MNIPKEIIKIIEDIKKSGFECYVVGGCVRDLLNKKTPKDYDIATNAKPEEVKKMFKNSFLNNDFGTVAVITDSSEKNLKEVQVTTYRTESDYQDQRHPQKVDFVNSIEEDLKRRDFTINAMALDVSNKKKTALIDPYNGQEDLKKGVIRAVGDAEERIAEDALRMMRAVRFYAQLGYKIEKKTEDAIKKNSHLLKNISQERIRDELVKIILSERAAEGVEKLREVNLLQQFLPELLEGYNIPQNKHHIYDCYKHSLESLRYAAKRNFNFSVRMAALLHDVGKPRSKEGSGKDATFYNHEMIGAKITRKILQRLKFSKNDVEKITTLVRYHLFYYNTGEVTESSVRRLLKKVGKENVEDLLRVRMADRIGSGVPKAEPYKLRHLRYIIDKVSQDPVTSSMLEIDGTDVMKIMSITPGPLVGFVLSILLKTVIDDPKKNKKETLEKMVLELKEKTEEEVKIMGKKAKESIEDLEHKKDEEIKKKHWVR